METGARLGRYRLLSELGSGGMGTVHLAEGPDGKVALKLVHAGLLAEEGFFRRFVREAEIGQRLVHENVVRTLDADAATIDGVLRPFLVMEYVEGQTLRSLLRELGRVPEDLCRHIGREVAKGLRAIHDLGVVHRDLKPENVLITRDHTVKVMDLGVARLVDETARRSLTTGFVGTFLYAAPEQFEGAELDARADYYSLGLVLYELATGEHPSGADDPAAIMHRRLAGPPRPAGQLNPQISAYFEEALAALLAHDRSRRPDFFPEEDSDWWRDRARRIRTETRRPLRRIRIPRETALFGRDTEIAWLRVALDKALAGDGQVVLIEGEAGIGKTRLVDELVGASGALVSFLYGSYPPGGAATGTGAFAAAYREHLGDGSADVLAEAPLLAPAFDALLRGDAPPQGAEPLSKESIRTCFVHATRALARERPTVVLVDDLHFAPEEGRALYAALAHAVPGHRIFLVGTLRPGGLPEDWLASLERQPHVSRLPLARLGAADLVRLLEDCLRSKSLARELAGPIALKSDGNPFFVFEIVRSLREGRLLDRTADGSWVKTQAIEKIAIPSSVLDLVRARIADLAEEERELLDLASCCGFEFDPLLVGEVLGIPRIPLLKRFAQLERKHRLVRAAGTAYVFDHHQVEEALYESLPELLRREYHGALGLALEKRGGPATGAAAVARAEHFLRAAEGEKALPYLDAAHEHLEAACLYERAASLARRALDLPGLLQGARRTDVLIRVSTQLGNLGRHEAQQRAAEEAIEAATGDVAACARATRALGICFRHSSRYAEGERAFRAAITLAREAKDRTTEAAALGNLGLVLTDLGRYEEALPLQEGAIALSHELGYTRGEAIAHGNLALLLAHLARYVEALTHTKRHLELSRQIGYRHGEAIARGNIGFLLIQRGRCEEARGHVVAQLSLVRALGLRQGEGIATCNLGNVHLHLGRIADAREHLSRYLELSREIGHREGQAISHVNLGPLAATLGDSARGRQHLDEALRLAREAGSRRVESYALQRMGDLARHEGDMATAARRYGEALVIRRALRYRRGMADTLLALARTGGEGASGAAEEALALGKELDLPDILAGAHVLRGDVEAARALLEAEGARISHADRMEARFELWRATGDGAQLMEAKRLLDEAVANAPPDSREAMVEHVRLHREIARAH